MTRLLVIANLIENKSFRASLNNFEDDELTPNDQNLNLSKGSDNGINTTGSDGSLNWGNIELEDELLIKNFQGKIIPPPLLFYMLTL